MPTEAFSEVGEAVGNRAESQVRKKWEEHENMKGFKASAAQRRQTTTLVEYFPRSLTQVVGSS